MEKAKHFDDEKLQLQWILSMEGLDEVAKVGAYGAKKYGQSNWRGGSEYMRYLGSCARHLSAFIRGVDLDPESGLHHLAHLAYNCLILLTWIKFKRGCDDRPSKAPELDNTLSIGPDKSLHIIHPVEFDDWRDNCHPRGN
jgi:hypothetical protein